MAVGANIRQEIYEYLVNRYGENCMDPACRRGPRQGVKLQIHEPPGAENFTEFILLCQTHNLKMRTLGIHTQRKLAKRYSEQREREGEREFKVNRFSGDGSFGIAERKAHITLKSLFEDYVDKELVKHKGSWDKEDLIYAGAQKLICSSKSTRVYMREMLSSSGDYDETTGPDGNIVIVWRSSVAAATRGLNGNGHNGNRIKSLGDTALIARTQKNGGTSS